MTIRESEYFQYANLKSIDFSISNVNVSSGMMTEPFSYSRSILEDSVRGRSKPYFQDIKKEPLKFTVSFAFLDTWDEKLKRDVTIWLTEQEYYQPLIFSSDPEKIYYALFVDDSELVHNGLNQGYVNLSVRCNDAYAYSPLATSRIYDWDESPVEIDIDDFSNGINHRLVIDQQNKITVSSNKPTWSDIFYEPGMTWADIF